ncbi:hypothetical protein IQ07DRAFT_395717 [Pyrenochaeta sp. DS3sAY3a]|nr:hypothetical protein IQ07DRAFT_395717 [Pyrenochaeta sp. DS3sAY3a]
MISFSNLGQWLGLCSFRICFLLFVGGLFVHSGTCCTTISVFLSPPLYGVVLCVPWLYASSFLITTDMMNVMTVWRGISIAGLESSRTMPTTFSKRERLIPNTSVSFGVACLCLHSFWKG